MSGGMETKEIHSVIDESAWWVDVPFSLDEIWVRVTPS